MSHLPADEDKARSVRQMFDRIAPRYDLVNRIMTGRMDVGWRKRAVNVLKLRRGDVVLDVACGTGDFCKEISKRGALPIGIDVSLGMLKAARTDAPLVQGDGLALPFSDASVDGVTCGFALRNVTDIGRLLAEFARVTRPRRRIAILEVSEPSAPILRAGHRIYFEKVVPMIGGILSDRAAYRYLPESTAYLPDPDVLLDMLVEAGFTSVRRTPLGAGVAQMLTAIR